MKYEITDIIERLMDSFDKSNKDAYAKLIVRTVSDLTETGYDMKDPDVDVYKRQPYNYSSY